MPLNDRNYIRGEHPPTCSCVECIEQYRTPAAPPPPAELKPTPKATPKPAPRAMPPEALTSGRAARRFDREQRDIHRKSKWREKLPPPARLIAGFLLLLLLPGGLLLWWQMSEEDERPAAPPVVAIEVDQTNRAPVKVPTQLELTGLTGAALPGEPAPATLPIPRVPSAAELPTEELIDSVLEANADLPTPTPGPTTLAEEQEHLLELINQERAKGNLNPLTLDDNPAAQAHAEEMRSENYIAHWNLAGENPNYRYTQAGGSQYLNENASGGVTVGRSSRPKPSNLAELTLIHQGLLQSEDHHRNVLDPWHTRVSIGISCDGVTCSIAQHFQGEYLEWTKQPTINPDQILTLAGRLLNERTMHPAVQVWWSPAPAPLTLGQLDRTLAYGIGQSPATFIIQPAPHGQAYEPGQLEPEQFSWPGRSDPHEVSPELPRTQPWEQPADTGVHKVKWVPLTVADVWDETAGGTKFSLVADLSQAIENEGPGVYTVQLWASHQGDTRSVSNYTILVE